MIVTVTSAIADILTTSLLFLKIYVIIKYIATTKMLRERIELNVI